MQKADYLLRLMKQQTDALVATDEKLQQLLTWVSKKSSSVAVPYKPVAVRAFYFARVRAHVLNLPRADSSDFGRVFDGAFALVFDLELDRELDRTLAFTSGRPYDIAHFLDHILAFTSGGSRALAHTLGKALQHLRVQLPASNRYSDIYWFMKWWQANGQAWTEELRAVMIKHRNIGHDWQFSEQQKELLEQYFNANLLLVDCLNSDSNVSSTVRSHIEETLLLPIAEIEKHR
jgi:predicted NACHT family NTPase